MRALARGLVADLVAGARLALFLPVRRLAFRAGLPELAALFVVSALVQIGADALRYGERGVFSWYGLGNEVLSGGLLLAAATVLALVNRDRGLALAIPVIVLASFPAIQLVNAVRWTDLGASAETASTLDSIVLAWIVAVLVRSVHVALEYRRVHRPFRAVAGGLLLATPIFLAPWIASIEPWFAPPLRDAADPRFPSPASEVVLTTQATLLDDALSSLEDARPGVADLYFVGFAGDAREGAFRADVEAAVRVMDERWGTAGRSVVLVNDPRTVFSAPFATLTNLRDALDEIAAAMDPDEDVAMVHLSSQVDADGALDVRLPPLELVPLTPELLRSAFDAAGIRYRVVVVSACRAGAFLDELADDDTAVIVASASDRDAPGCAPGREGVAFGDAFFRQGMATSAGIADAFDVARQSVADAERGVPGAAASDPRLRVGPGIAAKLSELARRGGSAQTHARRPDAPPV